ncbi:MAG: hypothetical protein H0X34_11055 [Chthoniobacterales bacterium]|nr:hypothetical protein [Chthoniobacterales bacterium]
MCRILFAALTGAALLLSTVAPASAGKPRRGAQPGRSGKKVWSGLVVATNAAKPLPATPTELHRLDGTLRRTFGYNQFEVIGQSRRALQNGEANWLAVSKHFSLHVDPRGVSSDGYRVNLQLFQDRQILLETDATLSTSSPLVIRGPQVGAGQLLLLLVVQ